MKYKKHIIIMMIMVIFTIAGIDKTYALEYSKETNLAINNTININKNLEPKKFAIIAASDSECQSLFGDKNDAGGTNPDGSERPPSVRYIINQVLTYVRIIVPILIIVLGSLDLAKAVIAGKEDEMKKAQKTFVMRIVAGVAVFFVPVIVDIVMWLAEKMGQDPGCRL